MADDEAVQEKREQDDAEREQVKETMKKLEEDPPKDLKDWPSDKAKYETFGGGDGTGGSYEDGVEAKLGPSGLRHHEDGSVSIDGEQVDNPDDYKGEPIPGGPTDGNAIADGPEARKQEYQERKAENIKKAEEARAGDGDGGGGSGGGSEEQRDEEGGGGSGGGSEEQRDD